ncbi:MAG: hypothetical protein GXO22_08125 [Aquificae bacterium]|nr:hypothetical protein [Aquificota bacterium]
MTKLLTILTAVNLITNFSYGEVEKKEIQKEIQRLEKLKLEVKKLIEKNNLLLEEIEKKRKKLEKEKKEFEKIVQKVNQERYKKLGKVFEKMEPEMAGEKISKMKDPLKAAYIIYNMKPRLAGEVMNYVKPEMVDKIVKILTEIKNQNNPPSSQN